MIVVPYVLSTRFVVKHTDDRARVRRDMAVTVSFGRSTYDVSRGDLGCGCRAASTVALCLFCGRVAFGLQWCWW